MTDARAPIRLSDRWATTRPSKSVGTRILDLVAATCVLTLATPLLLIAAAGIRLTNPGPIFYRARRMGRDRRLHPTASTRPGYPERRQAGYGGREFTMYKFRTMRVAANSGDAITGRDDARVFPFGGWLRATKIDELPQLLNVVKGDMSLVGPRPEAPEIVRNYYTANDLTTLRIAPGITSPGTLYYYTHGEALLPSKAVVETYVQHLLPVKLALDRVYMRRPSVFYDLQIILRTARLLVARMLGRHNFSDPPELADADVTIPYRSMRSRVVDARS